MWPLITGFFSGNKLILYAIAAAAILTAVGSFAWSYSSIKGERDDALESVGRLEGELRDAAQIANDNAQALIEGLALAESNLQAVIDERDAAEARKETVRVIIREIETAPPEDDGPVAVVLSRALAHIDGLRINTGDGTDRPDEAGADGSAGRFDEMP